MLGLVELRGHLVQRLRDMVRNGELTERALSQPHIHNVLKGKRALSVEMADVILNALNLDVHDLLKQSALGQNNQATAGK